jgi:hypothetical protein
MFTIKQTRTYPTEFEVTNKADDTKATFTGTNAPAAAEEYAAFKNLAPAGSAK